MQLEQRLSEGLSKMGMDLREDIQEKLIRYIQLIQKWNKTYNLTAIRNLDQMVIRHLLDSLSVLPFITESSILDVGSGAGLPGIPLALALADKRFILLDSNGKKTRFLTQVKIELSIENIEIIQSRVEDYITQTGIDIIICRAFAATKPLLEQTQHLVTSATRILAMKAKHEAVDLPAGFEQTSSHKLRIPWLENEHRQLIEIRSTCHKSSQ